MKILSLLFVVFALLGASLPVAGSGVSGGSAILFPKKMTSRNTSTSSALWDVELTNFSGSPLFYQIDDYTSTPAVRTALGNNGVFRWEHYWSSTWASAFGLQISTGKLHAYNDFEVDGTADFDLTPNIAGTAIYGSETESLTTAGCVAEQTPDIDFRRIGTVVTAKLNGATCVSDSASFTVGTIGAEWRPAVDAIDLGVYRCIDNGAATFDCRLTLNTSGVLTWDRVGGLSATGARGFGHTVFTYSTDF